MRYVASEPLCWCALVFSYQLRNLCACVQVFRTNGGGQTTRCESHYHGRHIDGLCIISSGQLILVTGKGAYTTYNEYLLDIYKTAVRLWYFSCRQGFF